MFKKMVYASLLALGMSSAAQAGDLTVHNGTNEFSTSAINSGFCSTRLLGPEQGTTAPGATKTFTESDIRKACTFWPNNCRADIYMQKDCKGDVVGSATFSIKDGIQSVDNSKNKGYTLHFDKSKPFYIEITGKPK